MKDYLYTGRMEALQISFSFAVTTGLANEVILTHNCDPISAHVLGRAVTAGALLMPLLSEGERYNIQWKYEGKLRSLLVDVSQDGGVRGLISPTNLSDFVSRREEIYGDACQVQVIRSKQGRILASGTVDAIFQNVVNDLSHYFSVSEQVETGMLTMIGFNPDEENPVNLCQGLLIQALPECDLEQFDRIRNQLSQEKVRSLLAVKSELDNHFEQVLKTLIREETDDARIMVHAFNPPRFSCTCNREKMAAVMKSLPHNERIELVQKGDEVTVNCQFCNTKYVLSIDDCINIWNDKPF